MWKDSAEGERAAAVQLGNRRVSVEPGSSREAARENSPGWSRRRNPGQTRSSRDEPCKGDGTLRCPSPLQGSGGLNMPSTQGSACGSTQGYRPPPLRGVQVSGVRCRGTVFRSEPRRARSLSSAPLATPHSSTSMSRTRGGRRPWIRDARRLARGGVLKQYVEHGKQAQRSRRGLIAPRSRFCVRKAAGSTRLPAAAASKPERFGLCL
jgi:hypothetical protein